MKKDFKPWLKQLCKPDENIRHAKKAYTLQGFLHRITCINSQNLIFTCLRGELTGVSIQNINSHMMWHRTFEHKMLGMGSLRF